MITPRRVSYAVLAATIILAGVLHLGVPLLVVLFSYFALRQLYSLTRRKWLALALFIIAVAGVAAAGVHFTRTAVLALPDVADTSIPSASAWAQKRQIELPFTDFESFRQVIVGALGEEASYLRNVANVAKATAANLVFSIEGRHPNYPSPAALNHGHAFDRSGVDAADCAIQVDAAEDLDSRVFLANDVRE